MTAVMDQTKQQTDKIKNKRHKTIIIDLQSGCVRLVHGLFPK